MSQYQPIGPATLNVLAQRFQPAGTILYDNTYTMSQLLNTSDDTVLIKCTTAADALGAGASLRLDDTYQFQSFTVNGETYFYTGYTPNGNYYGTVGYALYGVNSDGTQSKLIFADNDSYTNTAAKFTVLSYKNCSEIGALSTSQCSTYPYVITAGDFPSVRLVLVRSPYDTDTSLTSDKYIGRIGYFASPTGSLSCCSYGYITLASEYHYTASPACGITEVPQSVNLGSVSVSSVGSSGAGWTPFTVTYECSSTDSPVNSLRIGMEPQNKSSLLSSDYRFLQPDSGGATGVGFTYRKAGEIVSRYWIQNSGCTGISTDTVNNSYCSAASSQGESEGWYSVVPDTTANSDTSGYTKYTENFEARIEKLPDASISDITAGSASATVNVLVNIP